MEITRLHRHFCLKCCTCLLPVKLLNYETNNFASPAEVFTYNSFIGLCLRCQHNSSQILCFFRPVIQDDTSNSTVLASPHRRIRACMYVCIHVFIYTCILWLPWLRVFCAFSSVVRQMPGYTSQRRGTVRTLPN